MNSLLKLPAVLVLSALVTTRLCADFQTLKIDPTIKPPLSPVMLMDGITEGKVVIAIDVSAEGKLTDWLVLGYTHPALVRPCVEAMQEWDYTPAKLDGQPVAVQTDITIDYTAVGVVISRSTPEDLRARAARIFGAPMISKKRSASQLDAAPTPLNAVSPMYAKDAEAAGVKGTVAVHFYVDEAGAVRMPAVEKTANPYLADMALSAVRGWKFAPPTSRGEPVVISARQEFKFGGAN
jgi:TonB family protein